MANSVWGGISCAARNARGPTMPLQAAMTSTLPFTNMTFNPAELNAVDGVAGVVCLCSILVGWISDLQLWRYMQLPPSEKPIVLETGLWKYSRHPNHFGEQMWWIGLLLFGFASGAPLDLVWPICLGVCFNHPLDTFVTLRLIEKRMLRREERREAYRGYMQRTSLLIPLPQCASPKHSAGKLDVTHGDSGDTGLLSHDSR